MPLSSTDIVRKLLFVPPSMPAVDLLAQMQASRIASRVGDRRIRRHRRTRLDGGPGRAGRRRDRGRARRGERATVVRQYDGSFLADGRAPIEDVVASRRQGFRHRRSCERSRHARRLRGRSDRAGAGSRRTGPRSRILGIPDARRRSAAHQEDPHLSPRRTARAEREARRRDGDGNRAGATAGAPLGEASPTAEAARETTPAAPADEVAPPHRRRRPPRRQRRQPATRFTRLHPPRMRPAP